MVLLPATHGLFLAFLGEKSLPGDLPALQAALSIEKKGLPSSLTCRATPAFLAFWRAFLELRTFSQFARRGL